MDRFPVHVEVDFNNLGAPVNHEKYKNLREVVEAVYYVSLDFAPKVGDTVFLYTTDDDPWFRVEATVIDRRECFGQKKGCSILVCRIDPDSWEDCQWVKRKR